MSLLHIALLSFPSCSTCYLTLCLQNITVLSPSPTAVRSISADNHYKSVRLSLQHNECLMAAHCRNHKTTLCKTPHYSRQATSYIMMPACKISLLIVKHPSLLFSQAPKGFGCSKQGSQSVSCRPEPIGGLLNYS